VVLPIGPTFRNAKFGNPLLRPQRLIVYTEEADRFIVDRPQWKAVVRHAWQRIKKYYPTSLLFFPFGITYLVARTFWLTRHHSKDMSLSSGERVSCAPKSNRRGQSVNRQVAFVRLREHWNGIAVLPPRTRRDFAALRDIVISTDTGRRSNGVKHRL
jgi:hypothetical protein